jgi:chromosome segregation ATPase
MSIKEQIEQLIDQHEKRIENLCKQEVELFGDIKKLNTQIIQLESSKADLYDGEFIDVNELSKLSLKVTKVNSQIRDKKAAIELIRGAKEDLTKKFNQEVEPLLQELYKEYLIKLKGVGLEAQNIIDTVTLKQCEIWELGGEYSNFLSKINDTGKANFENRLPVYDIIINSTANMFKMLPIGEVRNIREQGIEQYNTSRQRYGRLIR